MSLRVFPQCSAPAVCGPPRGATSAAESRETRLKSTWRFSVQYCLARASRWYYYLSESDSEWSRCSPGAMLLAETVRAAFPEGTQELDFLRQTEDFKYDWGGQCYRAATEREVA